MRPTKQLLLSLSFLGVLACGEEGPSESHGLRIVSPSPSKSSPTEVWVKVSAVNMNLAEAGNHLYLLVDEPCVPFGALLTPSSSRIDLGVGLEANLTLSPGAHTLCAEVADPSGLATAFSATVEFTVKAEPDGSVEIMSPNDGAAETATFTVELASAGTEGRLYVRVDGDCPAPLGTVHNTTDLRLLKAGETVVELTLEKGYHDLCAGLADKEGNVLPEASSKIRVYVAY